MAVPAGRRPRSAATMQRPGSRRSAPPTSRASTQPSNAATAALALLRLFPPPGTLPPAQGGDGRPRAAAGVAAIFLLPHLPERRGSSRSLRARSRPRSEAHKRGAPVMETALAPSPPEPRATHTLKVFYATRGR